MEIYVKIYKDENCVKFEYNNLKVNLDFENLVNFTKYILGLEDFLNLEESDFNIQTNPSDLRHYKQTFLDIFNSIKSDEDFIELMKEKPEGN